MRRDAVLNNERVEGDAQARVAALAAAVADAPPLAGPRGLAVVAAAPFVLTHWAVAPAFRVIGVELLKQTDSGLEESSREIGPADGGRRGE